MVSERRNGELSWDYELSSHAPDHHQKGWGDGGCPLSEASVAEADMHSMGRDRGRDARSLLKSKQQSTATGVRGRLQKGKYLSKRI